MIITHIGGPTALIEIDGWRILTDPTFDPAGGRYGFGWGTSSRKLTGPAIPPERLGDIDVVLLTHDHHGDNLDGAGRALLPAVGTVVTTARGAQRLALPNVRGLASGATTTIHAPGRPGLVVTATPARHGPVLSRPIVGDVIGFAVRRDSSDRVALWVTGDTILHGALRRAASTMEIDVALVHIGGVRFPLTGPVRYTMTAQQAVDLVRLARPRVAIPVHYEGWAHFADGRPAVERSLAAAPVDVRSRVRWLPIGTPQTIAE